MIIYIHFDMCSYSLAYIVAYYWYYLREFYMLRCSKFQCGYCVPLGGNCGYKWSGAGSPTPMAPGHLRKCYYQFTAACYRQIGVRF